MWYKRKDRYFRGKRDKNKDTGEECTHANYIIGREGNYYYSLGLTSKNKKGKHHSNYKLHRNANLYSKPGEPDESYMRKQINYQPIYRYTKEIWKNYEMPKEDEPYVDYLIEKAKNKSKKHK